MSNSGFWSGEGKLHTSEAPAILYSPRKLEKKINSKVRKKSNNKNQWKKNQSRNQWNLKQEIKR